MINAFMSMVGGVNLIFRFQMGSNFRRDLLVYVDAYFVEL